MLEGIHRRLHFHTWAVLLVLAVAVPLLTFGWLTLRWMAQTQADAFTQTQTDTARVLASAVDGEIHAWKAVLTALAHSQALQRGQLAEFYEEAKAVAAQQDAWIVLTDPAGQQQLNTLRPYGAALPTTGEPELVRAVRAGIQPIVGDLIFGPVAQRWVLSVAVPVVRAGRVVFILDLSFTPDRLTRLLQRQALPASWTLGIQDSQYRVITRQPLTETRMGKPVQPWVAAALRSGDHGSVTGTDVQEISVRVIFNRLTEAPWTVSISVPLAAFPSPRPVYWFLALGVFLGGVAVAGAVLASRRLTRPVIDLATRAEQILRGQTPGVTPPSGVREINALEQALVQAATNVQTAQQAQARAVAAEERAKAEAEAAAALRVEIAQRQQAEAAVQSLARFPDENPYPILRVSQEGTLLYANRSSGPLLRLWHCEVGQRLPAEWCHRAADAYAQGQVEEIEITCDEGRIYSCILTPIADAGYLNLYTRDVTERRQAEAALRASEARLRDQRERLRITLTSIGDAVLTTDTAGQITFLNPVAEALTGWPQSEAAGQPAHKVFHIINERTQAPGEDLIARVLRDQVVIALANHTALVARDGQVISIEDSAAPIMDSTGQLVGVVVVFHDVTEKRRAQETLREQARILDLAHVLIRDPEGRITSWNTGAERLYGYTRAEAVGHLSHALFQTAFPSSKAEVDTALQTRGHWEGELTHTAKDGRRITVASHQVLHRDEAGTSCAILAVNNDITELKQAEAALQQAHAALEQRVQERTADLAQKARQLQALTAELTLAEQRERQRLAVVLHDGLQQLLVAARLRLTFLPRTDPGGIAAGCQAVTDLLEEAIASSRTLTGELSPPVLQTGGLMAGLEWLVRWQTEKYQLAVELGADPQAVPDSEAMTLLLFQSVRELLFNVVKHAQVSTARVEVRRQAGHLQIVVSDQGVGFDPVTLSPAGRGGLGLASIRQRLEFLGGCVGLVTAPGQGCRITLAAPLQIQISLSLAPPAPSAVSPFVRRSSSGAKIRILLVDDHTVVRQALAQLLGTEVDLEVVGEAADGQVGVERTRALQPDVVLMDINMPGMNGIEATTQIRATCPGVQVIGLSMFGTAEQTAAMQQAGAVAYVSKSAPAEELLAAIRTCGRTGSSD